MDGTGDEAQCGALPVENGAAPGFEVKLRHYKVFEGMPVTFTCRVTGNPEPKVSQRHGFLRLMFSEEEFSSQTTACVGGRGALPFWGTEQDKAGD